MKVLTMNGKKAKILRGLAGVNSADSGDRVYHAVKHTIRNKVIKNLAGEVTFRHTTATFALSPCARLLYKNLKKNYLESSRIRGGFFA